MRLRFSFDRYLAARVSFGEKSNEQYREMMKEKFLYHAIADVKKQMDKQFDEQWPEPDKGPNAGF